MLLRLTLAALDLLSEMVGFFLYYLDIPYQVRRARRRYHFWRADRIYKKAMKEFNE